MTRVARRATLLVALCLLTSAATASAQQPAESEEAWRQQSGIEGEPISLDSKDPEYKDYLDRVMRMIRQKRADSCVVARGYKSAQVVIEFGILKDGRVPFVIVREQSEFDIYDEYAANAIKLASPFPPVPPELMARMKPGSAGISIRVAFNYQLAATEREAIQRAREVEARPAAPVPAQQAP